MTVPELSSSPPYARYDEFLDADPRRRGNAFEFGHRWRDGDGRYRVCWYEETGELTAERLAKDAKLELEDFHAGIDGPVEILARIETRAELERLIGPWPHALDGISDLAELRALLRAGAEAGSEHW
jgi:hypothetical protein